MIKKHSFNGMNQIVKLFTLVIPINIFLMNENKFKHSTTFLVTNNENNLTDLVNQMIQLRCLFEDKISKLNA